MQLPALFKRPAHTLLYITEVKTFRVDTDRKGIIKGDLRIIDLICDKPGKLPSALTQLIEDAPPLGRKIWIFYARLDSYQLSLPSMQVEGVDNEILEQALQFEYEALTGRTLNKSQLAYQFLGADEDMSHFWLNSVATETLNDILLILKKTGRSLGGLTHPGGMPVFLSEPGVNSWLRLESWPTTVFALAKTPDKGMMLAIWSKDEKGQWQQELDHWLLETGAVDRTETVINNQIDYMPETEQSYRLTEDTLLTLWLGQWAQYLINSEGAGVPLLLHKTKINKDVVYMVASGVSAALLCGGHFIGMWYQTDHYEYEFKQLTQVQKELQSQRDIVNKNREQIEKLQTEIATVGGNIEVIPKALQAFKKRPAELLAQLALNSPGDVVIETIEPQDRQIKVTGVALRPVLANELASGIDGALVELGWTVASPTKKDMGLFAEGGPWGFEIRVDDLGLKGFVGVKP